MTWGKGWQVGVNKAIYRHEQVRQQASAILMLECGTKHQIGERLDLCPNCQREAQKKREKQ